MSRKGTEFYAKFVKIHLEDMKLHRILLASALILASCNRVTDYTSLVDTRIGTESCFVMSCGNTYPATGLPFGEHLWSPQTGEQFDGWKYTYQAGEIRAFTQSHQCSPWTRDYAMLSLFPETGNLEPLSQNRGARFSHDSELAMPHFYSVTFDNGIKTEMAPAAHSCHFRFSFPEGAASYLVVDPVAFFNCELFIDPVNGTVKCFDKVLYAWYELRFDQPFVSYGTWRDPNPRKMVKYTTPGILERAIQGNAELLPAEIHAGADSISGPACGAYLEFPQGAAVQAKVATSYIDEAQAARNLDTEIGPDSGIDVTRAKGARAWNSLLGRIAVEGGTDEQLRTFYACLYHACLFPRDYYETDADGNPVNSTLNPRTVNKGYAFNDIGYWDAFRSQFPLFNILFPERESRYVEAMLDTYRNRGYLPSWPFLTETFGMIGNHAISLLADAWAKGIRSFDPALALEAYCKDIDRDVSTGRAHRLSYGRPGGREYNELGYVPYPEQEYGTAITLESAYDDWCAWTLAKATGNEEMAARFERTMYNYRNVFDPETGFMRGRGADGQWTPDFRPTAWGGPFIEGNAFHYNWSVFHDIQGLVDLYGSDERFCRHIDMVFDFPAIIDLGFYDDVYNEMVEMVAAGLGQYEHGNQPIHHLAYLYDYAGQPWKTQLRARQIMDKVYNPGPKGYPGDEDQGSMSSWYVMSALGLYPVTPGTSQYAIGSPLFGKAVISLENGNTFTIVAENNSRENVYIQSATLNGQPFERNWIDHSEIMAGGELHFVMGPEPNKERCTAKDAAPYSLSK